MTNLLKWKRSEEGYTETHCGRYGIEPAYCSTTRPQFFTLYYYPNAGRTGASLGREQVQYMADTQAEAKERAERHLADLPEPESTKQMLVSLAKHDGQLHNLTIAEDDATVEAITEAAIQLLQRYRLDEGDTLSVSSINVAS